MSSLLEDTKGAVNRPRAGQMAQRHPIQVRLTAGAERALAMHPTPLLVELELLFSMYQGLRHWRCRRRGSADLPHPSRDTVYPPRRNFGLPEGCMGRRFLLSPGTTVKVRPRIVPGGLA